MIPKLYLKNNVHINGAHMYPEMVRIVDAARATAPMLEGNAVWITSANDGAEHGENSLHYKNRAYDIRTRNIKGRPISVIARAWAERMQLALGDKYDVIKEDNHIHAEFDPKEPQW